MDLRIPPRNLQTPPPRTPGHIIPVKRSASVASDTENTDSMLSQEELNYMITFETPGPNHALHQLRESIATNSDPGEFTWPLQCRCHFTYLQVTESLSDGELHSLKVSREAKYFERRRLFELNNEGKVHPIVLGEVND